MTNEYFTEEEILETIKNNVGEYEGISDYSLEDFFNDLFNTGDYIIGYQTAEDALKEYGIFEALKEVQNWDNETFGNLKFDYANPEAVANALEYIHAYRVFDSIITNAPAAIDWDSDLSSENVKAFKEALNEL